MNIEIANRLVLLRKNNGLSQEALAEKLGISRQAVSKWERAEASPDTDNLIALANLYHVSLDELLRPEEYIAAQSQKGDEDKSEPEDEPPGKLKHFSGIHVKDGNDEVHIGWQGIYVNKGSDENTSASDTKKEFAHIVVDGENYTFKEARKKWGHKHHDGVNFPLGLTISILYIAIGCLFNFWHPTWLLFFLIPIINGLSKSLRQNNWRSFPYSLAITGLFLLLGFSLDLWNPAWLLFLTIPLYYALIKYHRRKNNIFAANCAKEKTPEL
jgi:transcriptional regulator with XRE-family HTH domain